MKKNKLTEYKKLLIRKGFEEIQNINIFNTDISLKEKSSKLFNVKLPNLTLKEIISAQEQMVTPSPPKHVITIDLNNNLIDGKAIIWQDYNTNNLIIDIRFKINDKVFESEMIVPIIYLESLNHQNILNHLKDKVRLIVSNIINNQLQFDPNTINTINLIIKKYNDKKLK